MPTQMGSERFSSSSRRMMMGMFDTGSRVSPRTFISTHIEATSLRRQDSKVTVASGSGVVKRGAAARAVG
jgi:hypothetical protein